MRFRISAIIAFLLCASLFIAIPQAAAKTPGQLRAMEQRAVTVTRMKNDFVIRVLDYHHIPYELTSDGVVGRLNLRGQWVDVNRIEIVPVTSGNSDDFRVTGHELFFYTKGQILHLVSSLIVH